MGLLSDDFKLAIKNKSEGISDYLRSRGKLYITPLGVFSSLSELEDKTCLYRKSLIRRFKSKQIRYQNWYIVDADSDLYPAETCKYCDQIDDMLFNENCWLDYVDNHVHNNPITDNAIIYYLYSGDTYKVTVKEWVNGYRPHID